MMTTRRERSDMTRGEKLMQEVAGSPAEKEIRKYLQQYGFIADSQNKDAEKAEEERHTNYNYFKNITPFLDRYRSYKRMLAMFREDMARQADSEVIGSLGDARADANEGFFGRLCRKLDLLSAYDERAARAKYENRIMSCHYIETAVQSLEFGLKMYQTEDPDGYTLLNMVYIEGDTRPTVQEVMDELNISGSSTYYRRLETARQRLATLVFGYALNKDQLFDILVFLKQQSEDSGFPLGG